MKHLLSTLALLTILTLNSCVELAAVGHMLEQEEKEKPDLPALRMVDGPEGRYAIAYSSKGLSAAVIDPYSGEPISVHGKAPFELIRNDGNKFYIPAINKYPSATKVPGTKHTYINPFDKKEVAIPGYKPGALVASPTVGTFFYLPR